MSGLTTPKVVSASGRLTLNRNGISGYCNTGIPEFGQIDALVYSYSNGHLMNVADGAVDK